MSEVVYAEMNPLLRSFRCMSFGSGVSPLDDHTTILLVMSRETPVSIVAGSSAQYVPSSLIRLPMELWRRSGIQMHFSIGKIDWVANDWLKCHRVQ